MCSACRAGHPPGCLEDTLRGAGSPPPHTQCSADLAVKQSIHPRAACSPDSWSTLAVSEHLASTPDITSLSVPDLIVLCVQQGATTYKTQHNPPTLRNKAGERWPGHAVRYGDDTGRKDKGAPSTMHSLNNKHHKTEPACPGRLAGDPAAGVSVDSCLRRHRSGRCSVLRATDILSPEGRCTGPFPGPTATLSKAPRHGAHRPRRNYVQHTRQSHP